jgi:hypothetical protein
MKKTFWLFLFGFLLIHRAGANETASLDSQGYIRHWLMLAPLPFAEGESGADAVFRDQIRGEASLRPKPGEKIKVGNKEFTWQSVVAQTNYFDFNAALKSIHDRAAGYIVAYIESDSEKRDVIMGVGSNDEGRIYFNGVDIYVFGEPRQITQEEDKGKVTLKKGINVIVFKVMNEQNAWQGAIRLLNKDGTPLKDVKVKLSP